MIKAAEERGASIPEDLLPEEPELYDGDEFFLTAFWALSRSRAVGFGVGYIPWHLILEYGRVAKLKGQLLRQFTEILMEMDNGFVKWHADKSERERQEKTNG